MGWAPSQALFSDQSPTIAGWDWLSWTQSQTRGHVAASRCPWPPRPEGFFLQPPLLPPHAPAAPVPPISAPPRSSELCRETAAQQAGPWGSRISDSQKEDTASGMGGAGVG